MTPNINDIFFYLSTLFAINIYFVAEQSKITIDFSNKTGQIEYFNLKTPQKTTDLAEEGLKTIANANDFDAYFSELKMISTEIYKKDAQLNATVKFTYQDRNKLLEPLYIYPHPNGGIAYRILASEKMIFSNGILMEEDNLDFVHWHAGIDKIELTLKHNKLDGYDFANLVDLRDYWQE